MASEARKLARQGARGLQRAEDHSWVDHAVRFGLVAYGIVHLLIAWLALQLALGDREGSASGAGALHQLAEQPLGLVGLWLVALGLLLLVAWRVLELVAGHSEKDGRELLTARLASALKAVLYASLAVTAIRVAVSDASSSGGGGKGGGGKGGGGGGGGGTDGTTAKLMSLPGGQAIVFAVGLAVLGYAAYQVYQGISEKFREHLDDEGERGHSGTTYVLLGKIGYIAKGIAVGIIGVLFCYAAITHNAQKSGGLDQALQEILQQPFGPVLLGAVALGIGCYGLYCFARARHLDR